jgi:hypothetical protein
MPRDVALREPRARGSHARRPHANERECTTRQQTSARQSRAQPRRPRRPLCASKSVSEIRQRIPQSFQRHVRASRRRPALVRFRTTIPAAFACHGVGRFRLRFRHPGAMPSASPRAISHDSPGRVRVPRASADFAYALAMGLTQYELGVDNRASCPRPCAISHDRVRRAGKPKSPDKLPVRFRTQIARSQRARRTACGAVTGARSLRGPLAPPMGDTPCARLARISAFQSAQNADARRRGRASTRRAVLQLMSGPSGLPNCPCKYADFSSMYFLIGWVKAHCVSVSMFIFTTP